jgi:hypothetical protein
VKRVLLASFVLVIAAVSLASADGLDLRGSRLGLEFGNPSAVLIYRPGNIDFKLGYSFVGDEQYGYLSGDYRIISGYQLVDFLHCFLAIGGYAAIYSEERGGDAGVFDLGAHIPIGLQAFLFGPTVEIFAEVAPVIRFLPSIQAFQELHGYIGFAILIR